MAANPGSISSQPAAAALTGAELLPLDQEVGSPVAATALVIGTGYRIVSLGNTNWSAAGAGATPAVGTVFACTAVGTGTGTAQRVDTRRATAQEIAARALMDPTAAPTFAALTVIGTATLSHVHGNLAGQVYEHVRNVSSGTLAALIPYRVTGSQGDTDRVTIVAARSDNAALMPASGILAEGLANNGDGHGVVSGVITGVNTAGFSSGAQLFVAPAGGLTATRPSERIQPIAIVGRVHASTGTVVVLPGPALSLAAFTGAYGDLSGRPDLSIYEQRQELRSAVGAWAAGLRFIYLGSAAPGTAEASTGWTVTRLTRNTAGAIVATATGSGAWNNYANLAYS